VEKKILSYIDGERTVKQIMEEAKVKQLTLQRALYGFLATGIIVRKRKVKRKVGFNLTRNLLRKIVERIKGL